MFGVAGLKLVSFPPVILLPTLNFIICPTVLVNAVLVAGPGPDLRLVLRLLLDRV